MLKQANDFKDESDCLYNILKDLTNSDLEIKSNFKNWSFNIIIRHLHVWNYAANLALYDNNEWENFSNVFNSYLKKEKKLINFEKDFTNNLEGKKLLTTWKEFYEKTADKFKFEEPKKRVKWVGPDMSVISSISARHMETWAHGQAIFDKLGLERQSDDRILNIVIMGKNTFKWSFMVNNLNVPSTIPYLKLYAPSGKIWEFNKKNNVDYIEGLAEEFCQVVSQVRNIGDVKLKVSGTIAKKWMSIAQCFAGKAEKPPRLGERKKNPHKFKINKT